MNLSKDEKLAIFYSCWSLAYENYGTREVEKMEEVAYDIDFKKDYTEELKSFGLNRSIWIIRNVSEEKKEITIKCWCKVIGYHDNTDWITISDVTRKAAEGVDIGINSKHLSAFVSLMTSIKSPVF